MNLLFSSSTWTHLRIPFSIFLLPVFLFALATAPSYSFSDVWLVFICLHILIYPASNGYNSYFDKDEKSIGGVKNPPEVKKELYYASLIFDLAGVCLGLLVSVYFAICLIIYGLISKAYSHPKIRLKKYPVLSWLIVGFFQGFFTFISVRVGLNSENPLQVFDNQTLIPAFLSSAMLWGSYPMTQIYQHEEDKKRGDITLSIQLGVLGTFHFTALFFGLATLLFAYYFHVHFSSTSAILYLLFLSPVLIFFSWWYLKTRKEISEANFSNTMKLNFISSVCLSAYFFLLIVKPL
jgi:1,4-dihydroxy-2-naphthoate octaprenyltransferase